jgi:hypothetical protein
VGLGQNAECLIGANTLGGPRQTQGSVGGKQSSHNRIVLGTRLGQSLADVIISASGESNDAHAIVAVSGLPGHRVPDRCGWRDQSDIDNGNLTYDGQAKKREHRHRYQVWGRGAIIDRPIASSTDGTELFIWDEHADAIKALAIATDPVAARLV